MTGIGSPLGVRTVDPGAWCRTRGACRRGAEPLPLRYCINTLLHYYTLKRHNDRQRAALKAQASALYQAFLTLESEDEVRQFLLDLCTPAELEAIVDRWWTASLLNEGRSYREIAEITGVSVTTIGRVARFLNMGEGGYRLALRREKTEP